ncbi:unnamed protein product [Ambrosiozyma monospora]|uniref:Unnamed protein product n=1 Tax=Ambrosiozyma monospora TaxID=43982 RepID=A0ACB5SVS6_AMBMO|nr:unnamed protein product [Ambrosiozyma monospora]
MAVIYYRFKSQRPDKMSTIKFDGTGMTVFELKKEVIYANRLLTSTDTDIFLYHSEEQDTEYNDDNEVIPRSITVLVRRTSAGKKGKGNIQRYITGKPRVNRGGVQRAQVTTTAAQLVPTVGPVTSVSVGQSEEDMINQILGQQSEQWAQQQAVMANATRVDSGRSNRPDEKVPDYYICYKCGEKGQHHIRNCPKNNDPNWDGIRVKKTTGIPKSQLKTIENPTDIDDLSNKNVMVTDEGKFVVAVADSKAWASYQKIQQSKQETNEDINNQMLQSIILQTYH